MVNEYFDSIISASEYLLLLQETVDETIKSIDARIASGDKRERSIHALLVVRLKLDRCSEHLMKGRKMLHDLARLEKILCQESETE